MKFLKNRDGYALLLVLFLVVFVLGLSAVFVSASINNSKQETTVDVRNQSIVAAEMGIKYNLNNLSNKIKVINQEYKDYMKTNIDSLVGKATTVTTAKYNNPMLPLPANMSSANCIPKYTTTTINDWIECETNEISDGGINLYVGKINSLYSNLDIQEKIIDNKTKFILLPTTSTLVFNSTTRSIEVPLTVKGIQRNSDEIVKATIIVTIPNHTSDTNDIVIKTILTEDETVDRVFIPPNNSELPCPIDPTTFTEGVCKYTGSNLEDYLSKLPNPSEVSIKVVDLCFALENKTNCNLNTFDGSGGAIYISPSDQNLNVDNMNKLQNIFMYVDGELIIKNSNTANNNTIVSRSYSFHVSLNITDSNLVVLGDKNNAGVPTGYVEWKSTGAGLSISTNSKMCINLNGIDLTESSNLKDPSILINNGQLILYPTGFVSDLIPAAVDGKIIYMDDFVAFLNKCNVNTAGLPEGHSMKQFIDSTSEIEEIVDYGN
jgi:hypothetical protein